MSFCFSICRAKIRTYRETSCQLLPRKVTVSLPEKVSTYPGKCHPVDHFSKEENNKQMNYTTSTFSKRNIFLESIIGKREENKTKNTVLVIFTFAFDLLGFRTLLFRICFYLIKYPIMSF